MRKNFAICHGCCWRPNEYVSGSPTHCDVGGCCPYLHRVSDQKKKRITWIGYILGTPNLIERPLFKKISRYIGTYSWRFLKVQNCFDDTLKSSTKILKKRKPRPTNYYEGKKSWLLTQFHVLTWSDIFFPHQIRLSILSHKKKLSKLYITSFVTILMNSPTNSKNITSKS